MIGNGIRQLFRRDLFRPILAHTRLFYDWKTRSDTIFALATAIQATKGSPLGVIRVSGSRTSQVLRDIIKCEPDSGSRTEHGSKRIIRPRHATVSKLVDPRDGELLDIGLVLWFPRPNSYTGEDSCEFHLHGSQAIIKRVLSILGDVSGLRPAEPGEFTRRAVENGKLDLIQAESLPELISARTDQQRKLALQGLVASVRPTYENWAQTLIKILAHLEASIDFGEDELIGEEKVVSDCIGQLAGLTRSIADFIAITSRCRDIVRSGARVSILGPPNAGKSTLMNLLCRHEKSIVSDLSGTTRDVIEHTFELGGHTLALCDTAGLRDLSCQEAGCVGRKEEPTVIEQQHNSIEREGVKRALNSAKEADLLIYLVDGGRLHQSGVAPVAQELKEVLASVDRERKKVLHVVVNKTDLINNLSKDVGDTIEALLRGEGFQLTFVSCRTNENIEEFVKRLTQSLDSLQSNGLEVHENQLQYVNERHLALLRSATRHLKRAQTLDIGSIDEMAQHVRESVDYISRIVGTVDREDVFDVIFKDFCIGK